MTNLLIGLLLVYLVSVVYAAYRLAPVAVKSNGKTPFRTGQFWLMILIVFLPIANLSLALYSQSRPKRAKKPSTKNFPQLSSLETLKSIGAFYQSFVMREKASVDIFQFTKELEDTIEILSRRFKHESFSYLLMKYQFSFGRILSILNESQKIDKALTEELLTASQKMLKEFSKEVKTTEVREKKVEAERFEEVRANYLSEIKEEGEYQRKKTLESLKQTLSQKKTIARSAKV